MSNKTNDAVLEATLEDVKEKEYDITVLIGENRIQLHGTIDDAIARMGEFERAEARRASVYIPADEYDLRDNEDKQ